MGRSRILLASPLPGCDAPGPRGARASSSFPGWRKHDGPGPYFITVQQFGIERADRLTNTPASLTIPSGFDSRERH